MTKLFELLAVEKTRSNAANKLMDETSSKFKKEQFFSGHVKTLKMLVDSPENTAIESSARDIKALPTTVPETLEYLFDFWNQAEDVIYAKNKTNQGANADILFRGNTLVSNVPVDELLGLEVRLEQLRKIIYDMPTLDASRQWAKQDSGRKGEYISLDDEVTSKTEKQTTPVVLYDATDHHPAQIQIVTTDKVIGTFTRKSFSGAATSKQKADAMAVIDELVVEVKQARQRANSVDASTDRIGKTITNLILDVFK